MCIYSLDYTIIHNENEDENVNRSHKYGKNRPRARYGHNIVNKKVSG